MTWTVEWDAEAVREWQALDRSMQRRILQFLRTRLAEQPHPRSVGKPLKGLKTGLWRYRVGDYRLICLLDDERRIGVVVAVGHRREVYR